MVETKVVVRASPAKLTTEVGMKFVPFTVSVKVASPALLEVGEIEVVVGTGLFTVKTSALDVPPPGVGFVTVILNVPAAVKSEAGIEAVSWVAET